MSSNAPSSLLTGLQQIVQARPLPLQAIRQPAPRESGDSRLHPGRFHGRFYILNELRRAVQFIGSKYLSPDQILVDFGCGNMPYRTLLEPRVRKYLGVDLADNYVADMHFTADGKLPLADGIADVVLSTQVLEHVTDPDSYLAQCRRLLKPGGRLILSTHGYWKYHPDPIDLWRWTGAGLRRAIELAGFKVELVRGLVGLGPSGVQLLQDALWKRVPKIVRPVFAFVCQRTMIALDRLHTDEQRSGDASVYFVVATAMALPEEFENDPQGAD